MHTLNSIQSNFTENRIPLEQGKSSLKAEQSNPQPCIRKNPQRSQVHPHRKSYLLAIKAAEEILNRRKTPSPSCLWNIPRSSPLTPHNTLRLSIQSTRSFSPTTKSTHRRATCTSDTTSPPKGTAPAGSALPPSTGTMSRLSSSASTIHRSSSSTISNQSEAA